jgi:hypothetical protein
MVLINHIAILVSLIGAAAFIEVAVGDTRDSQPVSSSIKNSENIALTGDSTKAQMRFLGVFEAGHRDVGIYKMLDASDDVICYVLMPEHASKKVVDGKMMYEGNSVGSISCVKGR